MQRLPSLNALRAFEAAARHLSLTKAGQELHVTPAAISHQIKALEADLGVVLLRRGRGGLALTETARAALPLLRGGFDQLAEAARLLRADTLRHLLTVSVGATFAATWLVRRLGRFKEAYPDIDVRLDTTDELADFARQDVDVAIRFGGGDYPGLVAMRLFDEEIYPVCSPKLLETGPPLDHPSDLARQTLLHVHWTWPGEATSDWEMWLKAAGAGGVDASRGPQFRHSNIAFQAAMDGQGVTLASDSLAGDELADGRLVRLFDVTLPVSFAYHLIFPRENAETPKIAAFRDWMVAEAGITRRQARS